MEVAEDITRFAAVDRQADPRYFIKFVDAGNALPDIQRAKEIMLSMLEVGEGMRVVDVGCGTGEDARGMAQIAGPAGHVTGVDVSGAMIEEATLRHASAGLPVDFFVRDAQRLEFPDGSFDRSRTERVLMHLDSPAQGLAEMVRVLRSGGRAVALDFDGDTIFADSPHRSLTRKIARSWSDSIKHSWVGRSLPRMFHEAGLVDVVSVAHAVRIPLAFAHVLFDGHLAKVLEGGELSARELAEWWGDLERADAKGLFHLGFLGFIVAGRKP